MPYSPKVTLVPPFACPERSGWCCLRCLTRRGINMGSALLSGRVDGGLGRRHRVRPHRDLGSVGTWLGRGVDLGRSRGAPAGVGAASRGPARAGSRTSALRTAALLLPQRLLLRLALGPALHDVALVDPHLDADSTEGGARLVDAVVDVRAQGVQPVSYTHLRAHETPEHLVCRLLLEKK